MYYAETQSFEHVHIHESTVPETSGDVDYPFFQGHDHVICAGRYWRGSKEETFWDQVLLLTIFKTSTSANESEKVEI